MQLVEKYFEEKRMRRVEEELPSALFHASTVSGGAEEMLKALRQGYGPLSEEARRMLNAVAKGESVENALSRPAKPRLLREALSLIQTAERTGADLHAILKSLAEDYARMLELEREKKAGLALQKYSLVLTAGLLTPLVLGFMLSFAAGFASSLAEAAEAPDVETIRISVIAYVTLFALMTSAFIAFLENKKYAALYYAAAGAPTARAGFTHASTKNKKPQQLPHNPQTESLPPTTRSTEASPKKEACTFPACFSTAGPCGSQNSH